ncbi:hypothetical protein BH11MYX3_BH11MYX3_02240 [soil metagenome]
MQWIDMCVVYPAQWLVIELLEDDHVQVVELCADGCAAKHRAWELRASHSGRHFCSVHTSYPSLAFDRPAPRAASAGR